MLGGSGSVGRLATRYLRIGVLGVPMALIALAAQGWLRGVGDLRTPLVVVIAANLANVVLEVVLVYGLDLGLDGSAIGTVVAQAGMGVAFAAVLLRAPAASRAPDLARIRSLASIGAVLFVRSASLYACFTLATAVCARIGTPSLGAHQIAFQLFNFLALVLDAIAIAGQVIVGRALGAGDVTGASVAAVVFALDGILIGAGDARFLAGVMVLALAVFAPIVLGADGIGTVWVAIDVLMAVRLATLGVRFASGRWRVAGATA